MRSSDARRREHTENRDDELRCSNSVSVPELRPASPVRLRTRERIRTVAFFSDLPEVLEVLTGQQMRLAQCRIEEERVRTRSWIQKFGIVMLSLLMVLGIVIVLLQGFGVVHLPAGLVRAIAFAVIVPAGLIAKWTFRDLFPGATRSNHVRRIE
jgi:hypothetical protein